MLTAGDGAVVVTVVVTVTTEFRVIGDGDEEQEPAGIVPVQETVTTSLKPPAGATESGKEAV